MHGFRRSTVGGMVAGVVAAVLVAPLATSSVASAAEEELTDFALLANGFSTNVQGGLVPVDSDPTGFAAVGCTRFAGRSNSNNTAEVNIPPGAPLVHVGATTTRAFTEKVGSTVSSNAVNRVADVFIGNQALGLRIEGIRSRTRAFHDGTQFGRHRIVTVANVTQYVAGVPTDVVTIPSGENLVGQRIGVPGLATVAFGLKTGGVTQNSARAGVTALTIDLEATNTVVRVGRAFSGIDGQAPNGIMGGSVWASQLTGLGGILNSGRTSALSLPCAGTGGEPLTRNVAGVNIPGIATIGAMVSEVNGSQANGQATARGTSTVANVTVAGGDLVIRGVVGKALVQRRSDGTLRRNSIGTTAGEITFLGETLEFPISGVIEIPGIARITERVVNTSSDGIKVVALRVELLQGSVVQSVLDLGNVSLRVAQG